MSLAKLKKKALFSAKKDKQEILGRFFKTGPGQYGQGDKFLGLTVPVARQLAKEFADLSWADLKILIKDPYHELRLIALLVLIEQYNLASDRRQKEVIIRFYLRSHRYINNWDLVDLSVYKLLGDYLVRYGDKDGLLISLAHSSLLWQKRMAMVATFAYLKAGSSRQTKEIATILLFDKHDLIQKAVGWMLREMGKRLSEKELTDFLDKHYREMPRTALRYAIERLPEKKRRYYLAR